MSTEAAPARPAALRAPAGSCDAHLHVYDGRFAHRGSLVQGATAADYRAVQRRLGLRRAVVVTPRVYGTDNAVTLDAIAQLGAGRTRGIAVLHPEVPEAELQALHAGGIRGVRFTLYTPAQAATRFDQVAPLAARVHAHGWHLQLHWTPAQIVEHQALLRRLPTPLVFDHRARLADNGLAHPAFAIVAGLVEAGRAWVKLSGPYLDAEAPWTACDAVARHWVQRAPERLVWGSDWPHTTEAAHPPDTAALLQLLARWADSQALRQRILVDNPAALYGFAPDNTDEETR